MARKKSKRKPPKRDTWKPTPLAPVPRTEEELRAHAQWQAHKRELEAERRQARDARERDFRTALQDYIRAAGLRAALQHDEIRVGDGYPLRLSRGELQRANAGLVFDRLVATKFRRVLLDRVVEHLSGIEPPLQARSSAEGVRLMRSGVTEAVVAASRAMVDGYLEPLLGNYVANGDHWQALRAALRRKALATLLVELPADLSREEISRALSDSERLRHDRTIEFGHPVHLRRADCSLRFEPVALNGDAVEVPFRYCADARFLQGALRLKTPAGPLALLITDRCDDEAVVGQGWILALHGYADLTCVPVIERAASAERTNRSTDGSRHRVSDSSRTVTSASRPRLGGGWALPSALEPVPATRALLATYVVGHRRRLSHGRRPSAEAREHAKPIGITLAANETWVKPHARGIPHDAELVFDWRA